MEGMLYTDALNLIAVARREPQACDTLIKWIIEAMEYETETGRIAVYETTVVAIHNIKEGYQ